MATSSVPADGLSRPGELRSGRRLLVKLSYGIGAVAFGVKDNGFQVLLLLFYNQALGLDAWLVGLAIMIALFVDALIDPVIGYLSDRLRSRWGRRHPFMYAAAVPVALSYLLLFSPPSSLEGSSLFFYLLGGSVLVRVCLSFYEIPSSALAPELTHGYDERTSFLTWRYCFGWGGGLSMSVLAFAVFFRNGSPGGIGYLDPAGYQHYGIAASVIMLCSIVISSVGTQAAVRPIETAVYRTPRPASMFTEIWTTIGNRSALAAVSAGMLMLLATGLSFALGTYFNLYAWGLSSAQISILTASLFLSTLAALLIAPWISRRFDKQGAAIRVALVLAVILPGPLAMSLLGVFPANDALVFMPLLFAYNASVTTLLIVVPILLASMLADVVEEIEVRTGQRNEGMLFALNTFVAKCASGLGVFGSTAILGLAHFPPHAIVGNIEPAIITHLAEIYVGTVVCLYLGSIACVSFYQITRERHRVHLEVLAKRRAVQGMML